VGAGPGSGASLGPLPHAGTAPLLSTSGLDGSGPPLAGGAVFGSVGFPRFVAPQGGGQPPHGHVSLGAHPGGAASGLGDGATLGPSFGPASGATQPPALQSPAEFSSAARAQLAHIEASLLPEPLFPTANAIIAYVWAAGRGGSGTDVSSASQLDRALEAASRVMAAIDPVVTVSPPRKGIRLDTFVVRFMTDVVARLSTAQPRTVRAGLARLEAAATRAASIAQQLSPPSSATGPYQPLAHSQAQQLHLIHLGRNAIASAVMEAFAMPASLSITLSPQDEIALAQIIVEGFVVGAPPLTRPSLETVALTIAAALMGPITEAVVLRLRPFIVGLAALFLRGSPRRGVAPCRWATFLRVSDVDPPHVSAGLREVLTWSETVFAAAFYAEQTPRSASAAPQAWSGSPQPPQLPVQAGHVIDVVSVHDDHGLSDEEEQAAIEAAGRQPAASASESLPAAGESAMARFVTELGKSSATAAGTAAISGTNDRAGSTHAGLLVPLASASSVDLSAIPFRPGPPGDYGYTRVHPRAYRPLTEQTALIRRFTRNHDVITGMQRSLMANVFRRAAVDGLEYGFGIFDDALYPTIQRTRDLPKSAEGLPVYIKRLRQIMGELLSQIDRKRPAIPSIPVPPEGHVAPDAGVVVVYSETLARTLESATAAWPATPYGFLAAYYNYELILSGRWHTCFHEPLRLLLEYNARAAGNTRPGQLPPEFFNYGNAPEGGFNPLVRSAVPAPSPAPQPPSAAAGGSAAGGKHVVFAQTSQDAPRKRGRARSPSLAPAARATTAAILTAATASAASEPSGVSPWFLQYPDTPRPDHLCPICGPDTHHGLRHCPRAEAYRASAGSLPIPPYRDWPIGTTYSSVASKNASRAPTRR
jgi:hypothetical protein